MTGAARYGSDPQVSNPVYGYLRTSDIARGRITAIDETAARAVPGVLDILTYRNVGERIDAGKTFDQKGYMGSSIAPLRDNQVRHDGQIVALVVADTFEGARDAGATPKDRLRRRDALRLLRQPGRAHHQRGGRGRRRGKAPSRTPTRPAGEEGEDPRVGDEAAAFARAPTKVDQRYSTPTQHHNPIELFTTTAAFEGGKLTVWESSQNVTGFRFGLAEQLHMDPDDVRIVLALRRRRLRKPRRPDPAHRHRGARRPRVWGDPCAWRRRATRASPSPPTAPRRATTCAWAPRRTASSSPCTTKAGRSPSRPDNYKVGGTDASTRLYGCPNVSSKVNIVNADRNTPGFMRSPPEIPYIFALESAMDELSYALNMDPIELRRVNDTQHEPIHGPSLHLAPADAVLRRGVQGVVRLVPGAPPKPASLRRGRTGGSAMGCASTLYPTQIGVPATARVTLSPGGSVRVQTGAHEIGQGAYTVIGITGVGPSRHAARIGWTCNWATATCRPRRWPAAPTPPPASATWWPRRAATSATVSPPPR